MTTAQLPWGALAPSAFERSVLDATAKAPRRGFGRALASLQKGLIKGRREPIDVEVYGFKARLHPRENLADKRVLYHPNLWDSEERRILAELIRPGFRFIDVGANTGLYSLFVAARADEDALIIAVEPQPEVKDWLAFNIAANGFKTIRHVDAAVAGGPGTVKLTLSDKNRGAASIAHQGERTVDVPTLGLLDVMDRFGIEKADALKIDIEGAEEQALVPFFAKCPPDRLPSHIFMESTNAHATVDCVELVKRSGYVVRATTSMNTVLARSAS
jgi:FkbM family methyltransferase